MTTTAVATIKTIDIRGIGPVELTVEERGAGQPYLVLHGGAGPQSVAAFSQLLGETGSSRVLTPTHPGFNGTLRPDKLNSVAGPGGALQRPAQRPGARGRDGHRELSRRLGRV